MDLLLHLIRKNEVDIFDIPIATITDQYLEYLEMMKALNIDVAGDFFLMASTLMYVKSRMLLPDTSGEEGDEEDPRLEITRPLLEYMKIKELAYDLSDREILGRDVFIRTPSDDYSELAKSDFAAIEVNIFQLIDAFQRIVDRKIQETQLRFRLEEWSINEKIEQITERLQERQPLHFQELFSQNMGLSELVATFLAVLELVHRGLIRVFQPDFQSDILLSAPSEERRSS
ncbi:MAG: segregation/condensation protein A [Deltaproteobacteria bacterium]